MLLSRFARTSTVQRFSTGIRSLCSNEGSGKGPKDPKHPKWNLGVPDSFDGTSTIDEEKLKLRPPAGPDPISRALKILRNDMKSLPNFVGLRPPDDREAIYPEHVDILVIGGSTMGSSCAYWLKEKARDGLRIVVIEKDSTYKNSASAVSVGELHQQFSLEENIQMSMYAAEFLRKSKSFLGEHVNVNYVPSGYLTLATDEEADTLYKNSILQNRLGAKNIVLTARKLKQKFPWLNVNGIEIGCYGLENEGWFDPWSLLMGLKHKAQGLGVEYIDGELVNFNFSKNVELQMIGNAEGEYSFPYQAIIRLNDGQVKNTTFGLCIIATGTDSPGLQEILRVGKHGDGMRSIPLPLIPRRRHYFVLKMQDGHPIGLNVPQVSDTSKTYFRLNGLSDNILVERSSEVLEKYIQDDVPSDSIFFEEHIRADLEKRVPAFKNCTIESAASGFYEYCTFDESGIIGPHPAYHSIYMATGFNGHGLQMAPAVGRAISELIINGEFMTIDLTRLGMDRFFVREPMYDETSVI